MGALAVLLIGTVVAREPARIDRLTVVNRSPYDLSIDVQPTGDTSGWLAIGAFERQSITDAEELLEQGRSWTFRVTGQGREGGEFTRTRTQLARSGWRLEVPPFVAATLRAGGAPPSP
jgi:hypothetical protein